tara:strand:- start:3263 stop:3943 length:681 start_codon:yes stop_codon:yes gene_type:complete
MIKNYIKEKQNNSHRFSISGIEVIVKDEITSDFSVAKVIKTLLGRTPKHLIKNVKYIKIGNYPEFEKRKIQAMYKYDENSIYVTNKLKSSNDLLDDLFHEVAHAVEQVHGDFIYSDDKIEKEFLNKRKKMWQTLKNAGFSYPIEEFLNLKYSEKFDNFLHQNIGYETLHIYLSNLFYSPYGATSLNEYFANGYEAFFMKQEVSRLKRLSPALYKKLTELLDYEVLQ